MSIDTLPNAIIPLQQCLLASLYPSKPSGLPPSSPECFLFEYKVVRVVWRLFYKQSNTMISDSHSIFRETPLRSPFTPLQPKGTSSFPRGQMQPEEGEHIYGTTINIRRVMAGMERFVLEFEVCRSVEGEVVSEKVYRAQLNEFEVMEEDHCFAVDGRHIKEFDRELYLQFVFFPAEMISCFDDVLKALYEKYFIEPETDLPTRASRIQRKHRLQMEIRHLDEKELLCMKDLRPSMIGRLVFLRGIVIRSSDIYPEMKSACFACNHCGHMLKVDLENARVKEPEICDVCHCRNTFELQHNLSDYTDKQYVKFQELPELVMEGETPAALTVIAYDNNVDAFRPGDRVELIGIYRAFPARVEKMHNQMRTVFSTYVDLVSSAVLEERRGRIENSKAVFTDQEKREFMTMAFREGVIDDLVQSFAPSIFGHEDIKKGILAQLFGGTKKLVTSISKGRLRPDINVCLLGDPSTAKSQLLQQVNKLAPRSIFTNGRGSSAVGLTANVRKDPETHEFVLQSGALVLSDQGICCIDEFDKMDENSRTVLLQAMEQQTISIAKAGIVCQLNSRTAILAAANPVDSKYDCKKSVIENINLSPSLLSRFDLIFLMLDLPSEVNDKLLATHILDFYSLAPTSVRPQTKKPFSLHQLARYITYAREYCHPLLNQTAGKKLVREYLSLRAIGISRKTITATPRQLESLIRLSEAFAKMRLGQEVNEDDVEQAVTLMMNATLKSATDPSTGIIDLDIITTGRSSAIKHRIDEVAEFSKLMLLANEAKYRKGTFLEQFMEDFNRHPSNQKMAVTRDEFLEAFRLLQTNDLIAIFGANKANPQFKLQHSLEM